MATVNLPQVFKELLTLLKDEDVRYLLIGGYAVAHHGYSRTTSDIDIWIEVNWDNAQRCVEALKKFGMIVDGLSPAWFLEPNQIVQFGNPPFRVEIHTGISGVSFGDCYQRRMRANWDGVPVDLIALGDLIQNKLASGRNKDLADLDELPRPKN